MRDHVGERNPNAKITAEIAAAIKQDIVNEDSVAVIVARYGVRRHIVYNIINETSWAHVAWPDDATQDAVVRTCIVGGCNEPVVEFEHHCPAHDPTVLAERNAKIIEMRKYRSVVEVARHFGISPGRVSQITGGDKPRGPNSSLHPLYRAQERARS